MAAAQFYFTWAKLVRRTDLSSSEKLVALALALYADAATGSGAHPGVDRLAADTGLSDRSVKRALGTLVRTGLFRQVSRGGSRAKLANVYQAGMPGWIEAAVKAADADEGRPYSELVPIRDGSNSGHRGTSSDANSGHHDTSSVAPDSELGPLATGTRAIDAPNLCHGVTPPSPTPSPSGSPPTAANLPLGGHLNARDEFPPAEAFDAELIEEPEPGPQLQAMLNELFGMPK